MDIGVDECYVCKVVFDVWSGGFVWDVVVSVCSLDFVCSFLVDCGKVF